MYNFKIILGIINIDGKWIFGEYKRNNFIWYIYDNKFYLYLNFLSLRVVRVLVNIVVENNLDCKLIDFCCGVGIVVIEVFLMGIDVKGYEINYNIVENVKRNLEFFGYENMIISGDMYKIKEKYDIVIIDLFYGLFMKIIFNE